MGTTTSFKSSGSLTRPILLPIPAFSPSRCNESMISMHSSFIFGPNKSNNHLYPDAIDPTSDQEESYYDKGDEEDLCNQCNDCFSLYNPIHFALNNNLLNTIHRNTSINHDISINNNNDNDIELESESEWISVFGTHIIHKGQYKIWRLKIIPRFSSINIEDFGIADLVLGICDIQTIQHDNNNKYNSFKGEFWLSPYFGYGYYGFNGKKFHSKRRGKQYGMKFKINDIIMIELNMQINELTFYVNDKSNGTSFYIDPYRDYVLAVALCSGNYDVQICNL